MKNLSFLMIIYGICLLNPFTCLGQNEDDYFINLPWTMLMDVKNETASNYMQVFAENDNELIFDDKLYTEYGGQGGISFSIDTNNFNLIININTVSPTPLRTGSVILLNELGYYTDRELGKISGSNYKYNFSIRNNSLYVEGDGMVDNIQVTFDGFSQSDQKTINFPWTKLVEVSADLINIYSEVFAQYGNQLIFNPDLYALYNGEGGFTLTRNSFNGLDISIKINSKYALPFLTGKIMSLESMGNFADALIGTISGTNYTYTFSIVNNDLMVSGSGNINNVNVNLNQNKIIDLERIIIHEVNYPWTKLINTTEQVTNSYATIFTEYKNQLLFDSELYQQYGGQGGFILSKNSYNELILEIQIQTLTPKALRTGVITSLDNLGDFSNVKLGSIRDKDYEYVFSIVDNALVVTGVGLLNDIHITINDKSKTLNGYNFPWTKIIKTDPQTIADYDSEFEKSKQLIYNDQLFNQYKGEGGINLQKEDGNLMININILTFDPILLNKGRIINLTELGNFADTELGRVSGENFEYIFSIVSNHLNVEGQGEMDSKILNLSFMAAINP